ncbi:MAG: hypothetical protein KKA07_15845 [Bacteroidetes bacterium]|nr:hypothetical protein [Bacteroidota bacterium]MBU1720536.1 hypothetical protein [Bacteroidota bacterium]
MKPFVLFSVFISLVACKETYQNDDLKYFAGDWAIVKATNGATTLYEDLGSMLINPDGSGSLHLKSVDYTPEGEEVNCTFVLQTIVGRDTYIYLIALKKWDVNGKPTEYLCDEGELHLRVLKQKKKEMILNIGATHNIYECVVAGGYGSVDWHMERK